MQLNLYQPNKELAPFWATESNAVVADACQTQTLAHELRAGVQVAVPGGVATALPDFDLETFSMAGYEWNDEKKKWMGLGQDTAAKKKGLSQVGTFAYAEHPSTTVLSIAYNLKDGVGPRMWLPGMPPPQDLINHIARNGLLEAHNCLFEWAIWHYVLHLRWGWPPLPFQILRDSIEKARASSYPAALGNLGAVLQLEQEKLKTGKKLLDLYSVPQNYPKNPERSFNSPQRQLRDTWDDEVGLYKYNIRDIETECEASLRIPDLEGDELEFALATRAMNIKGIQVDIESVNACIQLLDEVYDLGDQSVKAYTDGSLDSIRSPKKIITWLADTFNLHVEDLDDDAIEGLLARDIPDHAKYVLQLRQSLGSAGVKKLYAMRNMANADGRLRNLFIYHGARTGRDTGADVQPQNLVKAGSKMRRCEDMTCRAWYAPNLAACPSCGAPEEFSTVEKWDHEATEVVLHDIKALSTSEIIQRYGDPVKAVSGCVRGLLTAAPGHDLICTDYSSIEAVVTAAISGEQWRLDALRDGKDIYYLSAAAITGTPYEEYIAYKEEHGDHHPDRAAIGKYAELSLGFGGWVNGWRGFDKSDMFTDDELKDIIVKWREASPAIVEMWGGQCRGKPWRPTSYELYGIEGAVIQAIQNPGQAYAAGVVTYCVQDDILFCRLPSGRLLTYHEPRLLPGKWAGTLAISYMTWNSNANMGKKGWVRINTYSGRIFQNAVQSIARDIMRHAVLNCERAGYPVVLRVHDELAAEIPQGFGSIEEFERLVNDLPHWAASWPIVAKGGWRGFRFRKD